MTLKCICSHMSAIWYWYSHGPTILRASPPSSLERMDASVAGPSGLDKFDFDAAGICAAPMPAFPIPSGATGIDVLVRDNVGSRNLEGFSLHRWRGDIPPGAVRVVAPGIHMCTPELAFVQMAPILGVTALVRLGLSLCAGYWLEPEHGDIVRREALTSVTRIREFIARSGRRAAIERCRRAAALLADGAVSPREIVLYMLCCMPARMGGYGLGGALFNRGIKIKDEEVFLLDRPDREVVRPDISWPGTNVRAEYLGHDHDCKIEEDRRRDNLVTALGYRSFQVDASQVSDPVAFDVTMRQVAWALGRRIPERTDDWLQARGDLRQLLLGHDRVRM